MEEIVTEEITATQSARSKKKRIIIIVVIAAIVLGLAISIIYENSDKKSLEDLATRFVTDECIRLTGGEARVTDVNIQTTLYRKEGGFTIYTLKGTYKMKDPYARTLSGNFQMEVEKIGDHKWNVIDVTLYAPGLN